MKLVVVVVVAFVGVGKFSSSVVGCVAKLLLCSWRPLCVLSVALEAGAHWRGSRAADAAIKGSEEGFDRITEDRCALPVSWKFAASWRFAKFAKFEKVQESKKMADGPKNMGFSPPFDDARRVENAKIKNGVNLA